MSLRPVAVHIMPVHIEMINPLRVEQGGTALDAVNLVTQVQKVFGQIRTVLAGDTGDEGFAGHVSNL
jgi:hypothetical protein